jgi:hypothetical protein
MERTTKMKILSVGNFGHGWDGSICDEEHIASALEQLGHEVTRCQRDEVSLNNGTNDYDFTLISQWDGYGDLSWLPKPVVYWAFDYQADGQGWHEELVRKADIYLSKRLADSKYENWQWLAQDFAPSFLTPHPDWHYQHRGEIEVLFTGSYLDWATIRNKTLREVNKHFKLVIHSVNPWPEDWGLDVRPPRMDLDLPELYNQARVILSIDHTIEAGYWSDRNAQIMACGRRPLFRYTPLSEARFGDRVDYFYDVADCIDKIAHWEERPTNADGLRVKDRVKDLLTIVRAHGS